MGVIPGPSEPKLIMNSYLGPLVEELKEGWDVGFNVVTSENVTVTIRVALTCIACDIPASRKVVGFLGPACGTQFYLIYRTLTLFVLQSLIQCTICILAQENMHSKLG